MAPAASKLAAKKKKGDDDVDPTLKRIAALFELEKATQDGTLTPNDERLAQTEFWSAMRSILAVNELTSGVEILDDIAAALISGQADPATAFDPKEATKSGYDPFKKANGSYAALAPDKGLPVDYDDVVAAQGDDDATSETVDEVIEMTGDQSQVVEEIPAGNNTDESSDSSSTASLLRKVNEKTPKTESKQVGLFEAKVVAMLTSPAFPFNN
ncbi:hypothetical protein PF007_g16499 [Phytophthora fragariae]|uniref:Uncharacterized protein n=1 Tax=Phytophthora fragariae TaxID=53985 RepID=A0A6A3RPM4_9STRA|nr:hypothetical protein PF007_g16499 [Phytophthora fragariae]